jgi:glycosyltransferase involved in cell wall biosynthesis
LLTIDGKNKFALMDAMTSAPRISVVVPAFNEAEVLLSFHARLDATMRLLGEPWELVFVNDGSRDGTLSIMEGLHRGNPHVSVVNLSRNFGKEIAITAGLDHAVGEALVIIDADLQDPPELIPELGNTGKTPGELRRQVGWPRHRTSSGSGGMSAAPATPSRLPR